MRHAISICGRIVKQQTSNAQVGNQPGYGPRFKPGARFLNLANLPPTSRAASYLAENGDPIPSMSATEQRSKEAKNWQSTVNHWQRR